MRCEPDCECGRHIVEPGTRGGYRWSDLHPSRHAMHKRIVTRRGKASDYDCVGCGNPARDWSHTHDTDREDANNYSPRCKLCHRRYDQPEYWGKPGFREAQIESMIGRTHSEETKEKMRKSARERWARDGEREKQSIAIKKTWVSPDEA